MTVPSAFAAARAEILEDIAHQAALWHRDPAGIRLMAVSKTQSHESLENAIACGQRLFGENRVQEAQAHWAQSGLLDCTPDLDLHLIGPLQSNKVKAAIGLFSTIQTLDRISLADALADALAKQNRKIACYIQVNTGEEGQKAGVAIKDLEMLYRHATENAGLSVTGLMCIPPASALASPHFALLANLAKHFNLPELSMGMSADYKQALPLGATIIRIGTALFGAR